MWYLAELMPVTEGERFVNIGGTGSLLPYLSRKVGRNGSVVRVDFCRGMLSANRWKTKGPGDICRMEADAVALPLAGGGFAVATCSHVFCERKGKTQEQFF